VSNAVTALATQGKKTEALRYAEACRSRQGTCLATFRAVATKYPEQPGTSLTDPSRHIADSRL
jgi:hypothetical protein